VELVPSKRHLGHLLHFAEQMRGLDVTVVLTDGAGGHGAPHPDPLAAELAQSMGRQPVVTVACKTASRDELLVRLDAIHGRGLQNVLVVSGDYPRGGPAPASGRSGTPGPPGALHGPFPLDSVQLLQAAAEDGAPGTLLGAAVSPFKYTEADVWGQRLKTWKKWRAGAAFFATQIGFDVAKFQELRRWMARDGMADVPVLGAVYLLHAGSVRLLAGGRLPGVHLPPDLEALATSLTGPEGRAAARRRAALLADVLVRGLGYRGVHFCGVHDPDDLHEILTITDALAARGWRESYEEYRRGLRPSGACPRTTGESANDAAALPASGADQDLGFAPEHAFYLFLPGKYGLLADGAEQQADRTHYAAPRHGLRWLHRLVFEAGQPGTRLFAGALAAGQAAGLGGAITWVERAIKARTLGCEMCGDCRIAFLQFRCPEPARGCPKGLVNGPCAGGTVDGRCEVDATRQCYWGVVVESALAGSAGETGKSDGAASSGLAPLYAAQPPRDPALRGTSSWLNHFAGRTPLPVSLGAPPSRAEHPSAYQLGTREPAG